MPHFLLYFQFHVKQKLSNFPATELRLAATNVFLPSQSRAMIRDVKQTLSISVIMHPFWMYPWAPYAEASNRLCAHFLCFTSTAHEALCHKLGQNT